jgi:hypothetical protein
LCGHGDEFFARTFHSGAEAKRDLTWTETEAEMIARFTSQIVERLFLSLTSTSVVVREAFSGANQNGTPDQRHD